MTRIDMTQNQLSCWTFGMTALYIPQEALPHNRGESDAPLRVGCFLSP